MLINNLTNYLSIPALYVAGYFLSSALATRINLIVGEKLKINMDVFDGKTPQAFAKENCDIIAASNPRIPLERQLGTMLFDWNAAAIREEISYRYFFDCLLIPFIFSRYVDLSATAISCISATLFAARHLHNPETGAQKTALVFDTFILGLATSLVGRKFGLIGSIAFHAGYNLSGFQTTFGKSLKDSVNTMKSIKAVDVFSPMKIVSYVDCFVTDILSPFILIYKGIRKCSRLWKCNLIGRQ